MVICPGLEHPLGFIIALGARIIHYFVFGVPALLIVEIIVFDADAILPAFEAVECDQTVAILEELVDVLDLELFERHLLRVSLL